MFNEWIDGTEYHYLPLTYTDVRNVRARILDVHIVEARVKTEIEKRVILKVEPDNTEIADEIKKIYAAAAPLCSTKFNRDFTKEGFLEYMDPFTNGSNYALALPVTLRGFADCKILCPFFDEDVRLTPESFGVLKGGKFRMSMAIRGIKIYDGNTLPRSILDYKIYELNFTPQDFI